MTDHPNPCECDDDLAEHFEGACQVAGCPCPTFRPRRARVEVRGGIVGEVWLVVRSPVEIGWDEEPCPGVRMTPDEAGTLAARIIELALVAKRERDERDEATRCDYVSACVDATKRCDRRAVGRNAIGKWCDDHGGGWLPAPPPKGSPFAA